jgi:hypothetical protein
MKRIGIINVSLNVHNCFIKRDGLVVKVTGYRLEDRDLIPVLSRFPYATTFQTGHGASGSPLTSIWECQG